MPPNSIRIGLVTGANEGIGLEIARHIGKAEGATAAVRLALLPGDGPTGGFFSAKGREPW
jgi:hypothetical protein